jgi:hypothetical protein
MANRRPEKPPISLKKKGSKLVENTSNLIAKRSLRASSGDYEKR